MIPVDINKLIQGTEKLLKRLLFEDVRLETHLASDKIIIMADATHIDQILFNLVTNARDAMPKGGKLGIETRSVELDTEFIKAHGFGKPGSYALLSISDTGEGMDEATKEKIFDPFFTTKEMGKGTGLGLSTVYGVVKQHNGYITVYSEPDTGTAFHIYFPEIKATIDEEVVSSWDIREGSETILVAEDNENVRTFMRDILVRYGYMVIEAVDGEEAIDKFKKYNTIAMVILDTVMPKKNGKEAYDQMKKDRPDVKVLFTSGYTKDIVLDKGIREKEFDFIAKPLSPNELLKRVRDILDRE
ncbi:MAG: ATP-binding protein [Deltaproteobacteria bacterium]|nr:ATP-binding protein [Deltaproteobacteria bacterium]